MGIAGKKFKMNLQSFIWDKDQLLANFLAADLSAFV